MKPETKKERYSVGNSQTAVWIYDSKTAGCGQAFGHVIRIGVLGDGYGCLQTLDEAKRLAKKICKFLNN